MEKKIIYSGIQPTGRITLGNCIGAINNWLNLQNDDNFQCIYSLADLHGLTIRHVPSEYRNGSLSSFAQLLAMGLSPEKNIMYFQSHVHEHAELTWILNCFTYIGEASRMTQFKEKSTKHADNVNMGLMDYPVLMAADILLFNSAMVPVGLDQKQHVELARDLASRFNNAFSPTFTVPEPSIKKLGAKIMSLQNPLVKMSKSDTNVNAAVFILDSNDDIMRKFRRAVTDSDGDVRLGEDKPGVTNLLTIYSAVSGKSLEDVLTECQSMNYAQLKEIVGESVVAYLEPVRMRYEKIINDKEYLLGVAKDGAEKASVIARKTLRKVYKKVGLVQL